jgi:hypothetical protein
MIVAFFFGALVGISATILLALYLTARDKSEPKPQHSVSAISMNPNGNDTGIDAGYAYQLRKIFKDLESGHG